MSVYTDGVTCEYWGFLTFLKFLANTDRRLVSFTLPLHYNHPAGHAANDLKNVNEYLICRGISEIHVCFLSNPDTERMLWLIHTWSLFMDTRGSKRTKG